MSSIHRLVQAGWRRHGNLSRSCLLLLAFAAWLSGSFWSGAAFAAAAQYVYDAGGRLVQVIAPDGSSAQYAYDPAGNILSITPLAATTLAETGTSISSGTAGSTLTIYGSGFSTDPAGDQVWIDGVLCTVVSATANSITVIVPSGASGGPITITVNGNTVTSAAQFTVGQASALAPAISGFTPASGTPGSSMTVNGSNFQATAANNRVSLNGVQASVTSASTTSLTVTLPSNATSGPVSVSTVFGSATSTQDFFVVPYGQTLASAGQLAIGGSQTLTFSATGTTGILAFPGAKGQTIGIEGLNSTLGTYTATILSPDGSTLGTATGSAPTSALGNYTLPMTGTYSIMISGISTAGSVTISVYTLSDVSAPITANGPAVTQQTTLPQQGMDFTFNISNATAVTPVTVNLNISNLSFSTGTATLYSPQGEVYSTWQLSGPQSIGPLMLVLSGNYTLVIVPGNGATGSATVSLTTVPANPVATVTIGGGGVTGTVGTPGQGLTFSFNGTAGEPIAVAVSNAAFGFQMVLYKPNGVQLASGTGSGTVAFGPYTLPLTGTYTVILFPEYGETGAATVAIYQVPPNPTATLTAGGPGTTETVSVPTQGLDFSFSGTVGQNISITVTGATFPAYYFLTIYNPDGSVLVNGYMGFGGASQILGPYSLSQTGTYTAILQPSSGGTGSATITLYNVPPNPSSAVTVGGAAVAESIGVPGQQLDFTFSGTAGQRVDLQVTGSTFGSNSSNRIQVSNPDGTLLAEYYFTSTLFAGPVTLQQTGTYTVAIVPDPTSGGTGSATFTVFTVPPDPSESIGTGGGAETESSTVAGQNIDFTFSETAGHSISLQVSNTFASSYGLTIYNPDGTVADGTGGYGGGSEFFGPISLSQTGTYELVLSPNNYATGSATVTLYDVPPNPTAALTAGTGVTQTATVPGQLLNFTFSGTAGQAINFRVSGNNFSGLYQAKLLDPNGNQIGSLTDAVGSQVTNLGPFALASTGTYTLVLTPLNGATASLSVVLLPDPSTALPASGAGATEGTSAAGQSAAFTFNGTAGQRIGLSISGNGFYDGFLIAVFNPDGTELAASSAGNVATAFFGSYTLAQTGTYLVVITPEGGVTGSITVALVDVPPDPTTTVVVNGASVSESATAQGQDLDFTFSGTAGQSIGVALSNVSGASSAEYQVLLFNPDGTQLGFTNNEYSSPAYIGPVALSQTGTYTVKLIPAMGVVASATVSLYIVPPDPTTTVVANGASVSESATVQGQNLDFTFSGTAGQSIGVALSNVSGAGSAEYQVLLFNPDGTQFGFDNYEYSSPAYVGPVTLSQTGTYTVKLIPATGVVASATVSLYIVPPNPSASLTMGGAAVSETASTPGQGISFTFGGSSGQKVGVSVANASFGGAFQVTVLNPDGSTLGSSSGSGSTTAYGGPWVLQQSGTYTVVVTPGVGGTGSASVSVYIVPPDATTGISLGGAASTEATTAPGQNADFTFSATTGQKISVQMTGSSFAATYEVTILNPDGSTLGQSYGYGSENIFVGPYTLSQNGTYTIQVSGLNGATGSITAQAFLVPPDTTTAISENGAQVTATIASPGQNADLTFSGTAGQSIGLLISESGFLYQEYYLTILNPDGTTLQYQAFEVGTIYIGPTSLPQTGTYTIVISGISGGTGSISAQLYVVPPPAVASIATDGTAVTVSIGSPGQAADLTFSGTSGQQFGFEVSSDNFNNANGGFSVTILNPDGTTLTGPTAGVAGQIMGPFTASQTGTYTIVVTPSLAATGSFTAQFATPANTNGAITIGGPAVTANVITNTAGATLTFSATSGQIVGVDLLSTNLSSYVISLLNPDGTVVFSTDVDPYALYFGQTLAQTGTYTLSISTTGGSGSVTLQLSSVPAPVTAPIVMGGSAVSVSTTAPYQDADLTFSGTAGQQITVTTSGISLTGGIFATYGYYFLAILNPDGSYLENEVIGVGAGSSGPYALTQTGTHTIVLTPILSSGSLTVSLTGS